MDKTLLEEQTVKFKFRNSIRNLSTLQVIPNFQTCYNDNESSIVDCGVKFQ